MRGPIDTGPPPAANAGSLMRGEILEQTAVLERLAARPRGRPPFER